MKWFYRRENMEIDAISNCIFWLSAQEKPWINSQMNAFNPCKFGAPMDALLKHLQKAVVPLGQGLTPTSTGPQRGWRQHTPAPELWRCRHILLCAVLHTSSFPTVTFPFGFIFKWTVSAFRPPTCPAAWEITGPCKTLLTVLLLLGRAGLCVRYAARLASLLPFSEQKHHIAFKNMR